MPQDSKAGRTHSTQSTPAPPAGKNWLLAIAVDKYPQKPLHNCVRDVQTFIQVLTERYNLEEQHIIPLFDENATADNIYEAFEDLFNKVQEHDNLIVYYSGHGDYHGRLKEGYWIPFDAESRAKYIANDTLKRYLREIPTRHTLIICDSCFSGTFAVKSSPDDYAPEALVQRYQDASRWVITSGSKQEVLDGEKGGHSPFADALLKKLRSHNGDLSARALGDHIISELAKKKVYQKPLSEAFDETYHQGGLFVFFQKQNEAQIWAATEAADTAAAYYDFWQKYPHHANAEEALWRYACKQNEVTAFQLYRTHFIRGKYYHDALDKIDDATFAQCRTVKDFQNYLNTFGEDANNADEAHAKIDALLGGIIVKTPPPKIILPEEPKLEPRLPFEPEMVFVPGGTFKMGSNDYDDEKPIHEVTVQDFYIGKYPVTQAQWHAVMGTNPSYFKNCNDCPVESVSWNDAQDFIKKLNAKTGKNYRLPTEAEWEYAARGGRESKGFKYAGSNNLNEVGWYGSNAKDKTHPVGQKKANELGIYDMSGNVWEWCEDVWHDNYNGAPKDGSAWLRGGDQARRVVRGGSWDDDANVCRCSYRYGYDPIVQVNNVGFRVFRR